MFPRFSFIWNEDAPEVITQTQTGWVIEEQLKQIVRGREHIVFCEEAGKKRCEFRKD